ncbi:Methionyl-tRNA synthetase [Cladobotryum mycophilum]|uniref:Methionyl-tRNA synthetase n=1 Tax=Cladobotryum mycophilum TaxID=491253 RepID=A0ABR0T320_9HYPO
MGSAVRKADYTDGLIENHKQQARQVLADNKLDGRPLAEEEPERCNTVISVAVSLVHLLANLLSPYMPSTSESIFKQIGLETPTPLFATIPAAKLEEWRGAFSGEELKRQKALLAEKAAAKRAKKQEKKEKKKQQGTTTKLEVAQL